MGTPIEKELLKELEANQKVEARKREIERQKQQDKDRARLILLALKTEIFGRIAEDE